MTYAAAHNDFWNRQQSNWGRWYVGAVRDGAQAYDAPLAPVLWIERSPYIGGTDAHRQHDEWAEKTAHDIAARLNSN